MAPSTDDKTTSLASDTSASPQSTTTDTTTTSHTDDTTHSGGTKKPRKRRRKAKTTITQELDEKNEGHKSTRRSSSQATNTKEHPTTDRAKKTSVSSQTEKTPADKILKKPNVNIKSDAHMIAGIDDIQAYIAEKKQPTVSKEIDYSEDLTAKDGTDLRSLPNIYAVVPHVKGDHKLVFYRKNAPKGLVDDPRKRTPGSMYTKKGVDIYMVHLDMKEHPTLLNKTGGDPFDVWIIDHPEQLSNQIQAIADGKGGGENFKTPLIIGGSHPTEEEMRPTRSLDDTQRTDTAKDIILPDSAEPGSPSPTPTDSFGTTDISSPATHDLTLLTEEQSVNSTESSDEPAVDEPSLGEEGLPSFSQDDASDEQHRSVTLVDEEPTQTSSLPTPDGDAHTPTEDGREKIELPDMIPEETDIQHTDNQTNDLDTSGSADENEESGISLDEITIDTPSLDAVEQRIEQSLSGEETDIPLGSDSLPPDILDQETDTEPSITTSDRVDDELSIGGAEKQSDTPEKPNDAMMTIVTPPLQDQDTVTTEEVSTENKASNDPLDRDSPSITTQELDKTPDHQLFGHHVADDTQQAHTEDATETESSSIFHRPDDHPAHPHSEPPIDETLNTHGTMFHNPASTEETASSLSTEEESSTSLSTSSEMTHTTTPHTTFPDKNDEISMLSEKPSSTHDTTSVINLDELSIHHDHADEGDANTDHLAEQSSSDDTVQTRSSPGPSLPNTTTKKPLHILGRVLRLLGLAVVFGMLFLIWKVMFPTIKGDITNTTTPTEEAGIPSEQDATLSGTKDNTLDPSGEDEIDTPGTTDPDMLDTIPPLPLQELPPPALTMQELEAKLQAQQAEARKILNIAKLLENRQAVKFSMAAMLKAGNVLERVQTESSITADEVMKESQKIDLYIEEASKLVE